MPFLSAAETNATAAELRENRLLFLFSDLPHDEVMQTRATFQRFLETSALPPIETKTAPQR